MKEDPVRSKLLVGGLLLILVAVNWLIVEKEQGLSEGRRVVLELAPRDPRSLMQGDYMVLRYKIANEVPSHGRDSGLLYLEPDKEDVARAVYFTFKKGRQKLRFREHDHRIVFGVEDFFFQEGEGSKYQAARYGELSVDIEGNPILVNLLDQELRPIR